MTLFMENVSASQHMPQAAFTKCYGGVIQDIDREEHVGHLSDVIVLKMINDIPKGVVCHPYCTF